MDAAPRPPKARLKAPSTADFPGEYRYRQLPEGGWYIISYVDAQNSFGAKIRSSWSCQLSTTEAANSIRTTGP